MILRSLNKSFMNNFIDIYFMYMQQTAPISSVQFDEFWQIYTPMKAQQSKQNFSITPKCSLCPFVQFHHHPGPRQPLICFPSLQISFAFSWPSYELPHPDFHAENVLKPWSPFYIGHTYTLIEVQSWRF